jgi:hypothetical protein
MRKLHRLSLFAAMAAILALYACKAPTFNIATKTTPPTPRPPILTMAEFSSHTNEDGKEKGTGVYVQVKTKDGATELAGIEGADDSTEYSPGTDHTIRLSVLSPGSTRDTCKAFRVVVKAKAKEADTWKLNGRVTLTFSDGTNLVEEKSGISLKSEGGKLAEFSFGG